MQTVASYRPAFAALAIALAALFAGGCESIGGSPPISSTADAVLEAKANAKSYALLVRDLLERDVITPTQAREQLEHLRTVERQLATVVDALEVGGDPATASSRLDRVERGLDLVLVFLTNYVD